MSQITKLEIQKNDDSRANLYIDDKFYAGVSLELCIKHHLKVGLDIEPEMVDNLLLEDEKTVATNKAIKYIGSALKTQRQVRDYLKKKEFHPVTIDFVIEKLVEYKYLDDEAFAKAFVLTNSSKYGKIKLVSMLRLKGVSDKIIDSIFEDNQVGTNNIEAVANKYLKNKEITRETMLKLGRFLCSRGYEFDDINRVINKLKDN